MWPKQFLAEQSVEFKLGMYAVHVTYVAAELTYSIKEQFCIQLTMYSVCKLFKLLSSIYIFGGLPIHFEAFV